MSCEISVSKNTDFNWTIGVIIVVGSLNLCKPAAGVSTLSFSSYWRIVTECSVFFKTKWRRMIVVDSEWGKLRKRLSQESPFQTENRTPSSQIRSKNIDHLTEMLVWVLYVGGHRVKLPSDRHPITELRMRGDLLRPSLLRVSAGQRQL
jgi:hypothetical protein